MIVVVGRERKRKDKKREEKIGQARQKKGKRKKKSNILVARISICIMIISRVTKL